MCHISLLVFLSFSWFFELHCLDARTAEPASSGLAVGNDTTLMLAHPQQTNQSRSQPEDGREEGKGEDGLEAAALVAAGGDVVPVEDGAAGRTEQLAQEQSVSVRTHVWPFKFLFSLPLSSFHFSSFSPPPPPTGALGWMGCNRACVENTYVGKKSESRPPQQTHKHINRPVCKGARKGKQPDEGEEDGQTSHADGVDEAGVVPCRALRLVQVVARDAGDDGGKDEFCRAQNKADDAINSHCDLRFLLRSLSLLFFSFVSLSAFPLPVSLFSFLVAKRELGGIRDDGLRVYVDRQRFFQGLQPRRRGREGGSHTLFMQTSKVDLDMGGKQNLLHATHTDPVTYTYVRIFGAGHIRKRKIYVGAKWSKRLRVQRPLRHATRGDLHATSLISCILIAMAPLLPCGKIRKLSWHRAWMGWW